MLLSAQNWQLCWLNRQLCTRKPKQQNIEIEASKIISLCLNCRKKKSDYLQDNSSELASLHYITCLRCFLVFFFWSDIFLMCMTLSPVKPVTRLQISWTCAEEMINLQGDTQACTNRKKRLNIHDVTLVGKENKWRGRCLGAYFSLKGCAAEIVQAGRQEVFIFHTLSHWSSPCSPDCSSHPTGQLRWETMAARPQLFSLKQRKSINKDAQRYY